MYPFYIDPAQLDLFVEEIAKQPTQEDLAQEMNSLPKEEHPTEVTGYLCCTKCGFINQYKLPQKNWVCTACKEFDTWIKS